VIVVSGFAVKSSMLEGLLVHELSHVYRNATNHPSHNEKIIAHSTSSFVKLHSIDEDYQRQTLHQAVNHIQDLYADDIAIKVLSADQNLQPIFDMLGDFFLGWIKEEPVKLGSKRKESWINAGIFLNNCFAVSNIQRRKVESSSEKAKFRNEEFLRKVDPSARSSFSYFNKFMVNLKEDMGENEFGNQLGEYLEQFWALTEHI